MRYLIVFLLLVKFNYHSFSQKVKEEEIFTAVEKQAEYPGGMAAFGRFLQKNLPNIEKEVKAGIPSKLYIQLIIEKDSTISNISIFKTSLFPETEATYIQKLRNNLPKKWIPAMLAGKPVRSRFTIPINICPSE